MHSGYLSMAIAEAGNNNGRLDVHNVLKIFAKPNERSVFRNLSMIFPVEAPTDSGIPGRAYYRVAVIWRTPSVEALGRYPPCMDYTASRKGHPSDGHVWHDSRVYSIARGLGGMHKLSPLWKQDLKDPGGLGLFWNDGQVICYVWGVPDPSEDFLFRVSMYSIKTSWHTERGLWRRTQESTLHLLQSESPASTCICSGHNSTSACACRLHDYGFKITLP